jgi:hypothetical protein
MDDRYEKIYRAKRSDQAGKPMAELTYEELKKEREKLPGYEVWYKREGKAYYLMLDTLPLEPPGLDENEMLEFLYLRACYNLGQKPCGCFEGSAKICADVMNEGGDIIRMHHAGCGALYAALLSNPLLDADILQKTIDWHIPF